MAGKKKQGGGGGSPIGSPSSGYISDGGSSKEHDRFLPIANVSRIMKKSLPANAKISKEAKETVQECVSEFISFITGEASDKCQREKRKTINGDDLLWAMTNLGFENYVAPLKLYLNKYRETEGEKNSMAREEDHSFPPPPPPPPSPPTNNDSDEIKIVNASNLFSDHQVGLQSFNSGFYAKTYEENSRFVGYGDNLVFAGGFNGDAHGIQLHHGLHW